MKRVKIIGPAYPYRGGLASFNERLAQEMLQEKIDVSIDTFTLQYPDFLFPGKSQYSDAQPPEKLIIERKINTVNPFNWLMEGKSLNRACYDVVLSRFWLPFVGPGLGTINRLAKKNKHTKTIAILDNVIPHEHRIGDKPLTNYFLKSVDGFVVMSEQVENDLLQFEKNKPYVLTPHPLFDNFGNSVPRENAIKKLGLHSDKQYILFFGFIRAYKGLDWLLQAFENIHHKIPNVELIIAGEFYADESSYREMINNMQAKEKVHLFSDFIPDNEVKYFFSAANLIVQPYKSATQSGITQIAYHFEKPMVVTNVGGLKEMVPHNKAGYVVAPNINDVAEAIVWFFTLKPDFSQGIKDEKKKYTWKKMVGEIQQLYNQLQN